MKILLLLVVSGIVSCSDDSMESDDLFWKSNKNTIWETTKESDYTDYVFTQYFKFHDNLQKPFDYYTDDEDEHCFNQHGFYFDIYTVEIQEQTKNSLTLQLMQNSTVIYTHKFSVSGNQLTVVYEDNINQMTHTTIYNRTSLTYGDIIQCP